MKTDDYLKKLGELNISDGQIFLEKYLISTTDTYLRLLKTLDTGNIADAKQDLALLLENEVSAYNATIQDNLDNLNKKSIFGIAGSSRSRLQLENEFYAETILLVTDYLNQR